MCGRDLQEVINKSWPVSFNIMRLYLLVGGTDNQTKVAASSFWTEVECNGSQQWILASVRLDQSEKEVAAVFDLLKISLNKTDPTLDKSNALKGLVVAEVARAEAAAVETKSGNPNQIATDVCITLRYSTGGLLTSGVARVERSTSSAPDPNRLQIVNFALGELVVQPSSPNQMWRR
ncbi:hypothetical protein ABBQ32_002248 [Trebouxia sp. C0010 RCD-2024]